MQTACPSCDLVIEIPHLSAKQMAVCPHCNTKLSVSKANQDSSVVALSLSAIFMLLSSMFYPFLSFSSSGITQTITLPDAARILFNYDNDFLGLFIDTSIIGLPMLLLVLIIPLHLGLLKALPYEWGKRLLKVTFALEPWIMSEIFLIGVMVSMVKIMSMADITFGVSFWSYVAFVVCYVAATTRLNKQRLWQQLREPIYIEQTLPNTRAIDQGLKACHVCGQLCNTEVCSRCETKTFSRNPNSIQKAAAWLITSVACYIPANVYPIMYTTSLGDETPSTLIGGVMILWASGSYPIAMIIFLASVVVPLAKALVLSFLCFMVTRPANRQTKSYTRVYQLTEFIGKWSMIDVFVVAILVALVQLGNLMSVTPGIGTVFFTTMVICQMLAAHAFDPRLLWDSPANLKTAKQENLA
ncbi:MULTISPECIES: PqiA/YebS family transporter subunit [unclassified Pseudoalteromonas]|uniref:PqiA/YebS family transporter subunit n=1 Tax=unclassified Pseudoalteromonas TaxID=194690 RepID=UPI001022D603|nr:PqiA/YebS family transporter subunit [Pseudoalteromonas sp. L1]RZF90367.1 PqiA/YebS family transporter subunit [Pseudoalteromonas sp. CO302Y]RZG06167.1 PqiA/YebS family transporter subunit [Pseudoalteromonas sp. CO133X]WOC28742.1 PqiA/YebS family transporter subunit [Pseudoalteromonas sp. N1230-9]